MHRKHWLTLLLIHLLLGLFCLREIVLHPLTTVIGDQSSDLYPHIWGYWRWIRKFEDGGWSEVWRNSEPYLNVPYTGDLYHVDWLNGLLVWIGTSIGLPFLLSINAMVLGQWMLLGVGTIALCKQLRFQFWSTLFVMMTVSTSPFVLRFVLHSAVFERLNLGWLLFYLTCLLRLLETPRWYWIIGGVLSFGFTILGSWHYAMFAIVSSVWIAGWSLFQQREHWKPLSSLAVGCAAIAYPISQRAQSSLGTESIIQHQAKAFWDWQTPLETLNDFTWVDLIYPTIQQSFGFDVLEESIFIGWLIPLGILLGWRYATDRRDKMWLGLCGYFIVLTLSPNITVAEGLVLPSPMYYFTASIIPYFSTMEVPWEYSWMVLLTGGIVVGLWMEKIQPTNKRFLWLLPVMALLQNLVIMPTTIGYTQPSSIPPAVINTLHSGQQILDFPISNHASDTGQPSPHHTYLWLQTLHNRPIAYGIQQSWLQDTELWRYLNAILPNHSSWRFLRQQCKLNPCQNTNALHQTIAKQGFSHFVLHAQFLPANTFEQQIKLWSDVFQQPLYVDQQIAIFAIVKQ